MRSLTLFRMLTAALMIRHSGGRIKIGPGQRTVLNQRRSHAGKSPDYYRPVGRPRAAA
ncbi:hypothetical protein UFOVP823_2 [uncultured Caudovirales phage]|uniref:Uncharacterized protein n=1 Tax=uncultured Caudovirales phage TaxID=2100421 RepID=A0A6J5PBS8_9CAUD|nr:hypothetical protein UFOVP823_2 [uncultured Caudovirales phage]